MAKLWPKIRWGLINQTDVCLSLGRLIQAKFLSSVVARAGNEAAFTSCWHRRGDTPSHNLCGFEGNLDRCDCTMVELWHLSSLGGIFFRVGQCQAGLVFDSSVGVKAPMARTTG